MWSQALKLSMRKFLSSHWNWNLIEIFNVKAAIKDGICLIIRNLTQPLDLLNQLVKLKFKRVAENSLLSCSTVMTRLELMKLNTIANKSFQN